MVEVKSDVITVAEAAKLIGISQAAVGQAIARGDIVASQFGDVWQVNRASAVAYSKTRRRRDRTVNP